MISPTRRKKRSRRRKRNETWIGSRVPVCRGGAPRRRTSAESKNAPRIVSQRRRHLRFRDCAGRETFAHNHHQAAQRESKTSGHFCCRLVELRFGRSARGYQRCERARVSRGGTTSG